MVYMYIYIYIYLRRGERKPELSLSIMPGEMSFRKNKLKENMLCQVCLVKCSFAKTSWKRTCFIKYAWWNVVLQTQAEREHALSFLSSMPREMPFCKNKLKENMLCHFCQVCLVKCRFAKTSWKRTCFIKYAWWNILSLKENQSTCFVKYAWWNVVSQKRAEGEHALSSMPGEVQFCKNKLKENMLCQVCLVKCRFAETSWKRTCFVKLCQVCLVKYFLQKQAEREHALSFLSSTPSEMPFCKSKLKENMLCQVGLVKCLFCKRKLKENMFCHLCHVCLVKCRFAKASWKRTCFVKYAWWKAVFHNKAEREHALPSIPDGMPVCKNKLKENMFVK